MNHYDMETSYVLMRPLQEPVGAWKLPGGPIYFHTTEKPRWHVRIIMKWLMGWEWRDG